MTRQDVLGVAEARKRLPDLLAGFSRGSADSVFVGAHRKAVGVLLPVPVYGELRGERERAVDDAVGSLRAEGLEPSSVATELTVGITSSIALSQAEAGATRFGATATEAILDDPARHRRPGAGRYGSGGRDAC